MEPKLSVVLPVYGVEEYLEACLKSLANQTLSDFEVIIVDDGSPDRCGAIADEWAAKDPRFTVLHTPNGGLAVARNRGTRVATGEYLTFADSDDLIPPRAYELLVSTLDETGSDFAAGNAWRFAEGIGTVQSWTHGPAFETSRPRTHIHEFRDLLRDRMVWNKVFRRSFWDAHGFEFPAMKYEDYPVTLMAHLVADRVDVVSDKVYMWRNRESGDSITQQLHTLVNARDRVVSAEMVLAALDENSDDAMLRRLVHAYLIDIDIVALATALVLGASEDLPELERLAQRLALVLEPQPGDVTRLADIIHNSLRVGDFATVRALASWRVRPDRKKLVRHFLTWPSARLLPRVVKAVMPRSRRWSLSRRLRSELVEYTAEDDHFLLSSSSLLSPRFVKRAKVDAALCWDQRERELPVRWTPAVGGFKSIVSVPLSLAHELVEEAPAAVHLRVRRGALRWKGTIPALPAHLPSPLEGTAQHWLVPTAVNGHAGVARHTLPVTASLEFTSEGLEVQLRRAWRGSVVLLRPDPSPNLRVPVQDGLAVLKYADLAGVDPTDNPFSGVSDRELFFVAEGLSDDVANYRPLFALHWPDSVEMGDYVFEVHASESGTAQLTRTFAPEAEGSAYPNEHLGDILAELTGRLSPSVAEDLPSRATE